MSRIRILLDFLIVCAVAFLGVNAINWYPQLPDRIVIHLNGAGEPDGHAARSILLWGLLPGIGMALTAGLQAIARWAEGAAAHNPAGINMPQRAAFLALSEEGRRNALAPTAIYLRFTALLVLFLFNYIVEGLGRLSTGASQTWSSIPVFFVVGAMLIGVPILIGSTTRAIARAGAQDDPRP